MQSNPCDPCNPPVVKWVNPQPQPAQIWNPCDPCAPVMYNPCPPTQPAQLRGGKDFFDIQVTENKKTTGVTGPTVPLNNFCGGRKAILVVNVADADATTSRKNLTELRNVRNDYPAGNFEILAFPSDQFGFNLSTAAKGNGAGDLYTEISKDGTSAVVGDLPYRLFEGKDNQCVGLGQHALYKWLEKHGVKTEWNFCKVLLNECG